MSLVIDTGVLVSAAWTGDPDHVRCTQVLAETREQRVVPAPVLVEVDHFLSSNQAWMALLSDIAAGGIVVEELVLSDYKRVRELMEQYSDLKVGFVDCAVLTVVERLGEPKLAALDRRHFSVMRPSHTGALQLLPA